MQVVTKIEAIIPESSIHIFSPHYDDVLFVTGGYLLELRKTAEWERKNFTVHNVFSRSNYTARAGQANTDPGIKRQQTASGIRLIEDLNCIDELIGHGNYKYCLLGEKECFVRGKAMANSDMEFPHGMFEQFNSQDWEIFERLKNYILNLAKKKDTALVFPLAIKEHIDHFIVREAALRVLNETENIMNAVFYFHEDKPYGGIATETELARTERFIEVNKLNSQWYNYDPERLLELAFKHYPSQVEEVYRTGALNRAEFWKSKFGTYLNLDRICRREE